jgi:hypothetical protein
MIRSLEREMRMRMTYAITDDFLEVLNAKIVLNGKRDLRLNSENLRRSLREIYDELTGRINRAMASKTVDEDWTDFLIEVRSVFKPSPIGAFDEFENFLRAKQTYITNHPNPYYEIVAFPSAMAAADATLKNSDSDIFALVNDIAPKILVHAA